MEKSYIDTDNGFIDGVNSHIEGHRDMTFHQKDQGGDTTLRMYAILRGDLQMTPGKSAAQAGHCFKLLTKKLVLEDPQVAREYFADGMGTNVCLKSKNLYQLQRAFEDAKAAAISCELIVDEHHIMPPYFDGKPIITALGLGPAKKGDIDYITKRFSLLR